MHKSCVYVYCSYLDCVAGRTDVSVHIRVDCSITRKLADTLAPPPHHCAILFTALVARILLVQSSICWSSVPLILNAAKVKIGGGAGKLTHRRLKTKKKLAAAAWFFIMGENLSIFLVKISIQKTSIFAITNISKSFLGIYFHRHGQNSPPHPLWSVSCVFNHTYTFRYIRTVNSMRKIKKKQLPNWPKKTSICELFRNPPTDYSSAYQYTY